MAHLRGRERAKYVERMFSSIASRYDLLNSIMSGYLHHWWRRKAVNRVINELTGISLDVATGTGDFAIELGKYPQIAHVVGLDFSENMLCVAKEKTYKKKISDKITFLLGDAIKLPFANESFVAVTSGFSLRNFIDVASSLEEMNRVTQPGGHLVILEITPMKNKGIFSKMFQFYFNGIVPVIGALMAKDKESYTYLPESVKFFPDATQLATMIEQAGWKDVTYEKIGMGSVAIHSARKDWITE